MTHNAEYTKYAEYAEAVRIRDVFARDLAHVQTISAMAMGILIGLGRVAASEANYEAGGKARELRDALRGLVADIEHGIQAQEVVLEHLRGET